MTAAVPQVFWTTLLALALLAVLTCVFGRLWAALLPWRWRAPGVYYLAPVLGLATLTLLSTWGGNVMTAPRTAAAVALLGVAAAIWLGRRRELLPALRQALGFWVFALACGLSLLGPLFLHGAFNAHNDAFTYLAHSQWLQTHAFAERILPAEVTPQTTQIFIYQENNFRMGASFLLALTQALLGLPWAYGAYPAVAIAASAAGALAVGFALATILRPVSRMTRMILLALPGFTLGGTVFAANFGFLPQALGLALGASVLFLAGPLLGWLGRRRHVSATHLLRLALPGAVLLAAMIHAYSELSPFVVLALLLAATAASLWRSGWRHTLGFAVSTAALTLVLANTGVLRAIQALRIQSGAVVGTPVDWGLAGFIAHALGVHGGAWDVFQWDRLAPGSVIPLQGVVLLSAALLTAALGLHRILAARAAAPLAPAWAMLGLFLAALLYFRYGVPSPFSAGVGQSWSQFKLADWTQPVAMPLLIAGLVTLRDWLRACDAALVLAALMGAAVTLKTADARIQPLLAAYPGVNDLGGFYADFHREVTRRCRLDQPVFLSLPGAHLKVRQMAALYLPGHRLAADWSDDTYMHAALPPSRRTESPSRGCVVEARGVRELASRALNLGPYRIGRIDAQARIKLVDTQGAYDLERDADDWWHWVRRTVTFRVSAMFTPAHRYPATRLRVEYKTRDAQPLELRVSTTDGQQRHFTLHSPGGRLEVFDREIDLPPAALDAVSMTTDAQATPLGNGDLRVAAWMVRNLVLTPVANPR